MKTEISTTTLVSAFITNANIYSKEDKYIIEKYLNNGILLLQTNIQKVIYVEQHIYNLLKQYENEQTKFIIIRKEDLYLYQYKDVINNFHVNSINPEKDTLEYMLIICNKTEWVANTIINNQFPGSSNYVWVDFGIRYICKCSDEEFLKKVSSLGKKQYDKKIRIGQIWDLSIPRISLDIYRDIAWYFAGGIFGGDSDSVLKFAQWMKEKCVKIIQTNKTIMWEVNIWYLVYLEHPEIFDGFLCDHNDSLIDNY